MPPMDDVTLTYHGRDEAAELLDQLCDVYADAYGVEPSGEKITAFRARACRALERPRYGLITARGGTEIVGFVFGCALPTGSLWWDGLTPEPEEGFTAEDGTRTFALGEIEVRRAWQGRGIGRALHDAVLAQRREQRATLATGPSADVARAIYQRWGWLPVGKIPGKDDSYFSEYTLYIRMLALGERR